MRKILTALSVAFFMLPATAFAALVNINTADIVLLDTLPGIGPSKAAAIVAYRDAHGPFARIEDIQSVSGIGLSIYTQIKSLITVSDTSLPSGTETASSTPSVSVPGRAATYVPPPAELSLEVTGDQAAMLEVPLRLSARVTTKSGAVDPSARIVWGFGDGSSGEGSSIEKTYRHAGTYLVTVMATDGQARVHDEIVITAKPAAVRISSVSGEGITIANESEERLDLSDWRITSDTGIFRIPFGTTLLPKASILFPFSITNLPLAFDAALLYPDSVVAARYASSTPVTIAATAAGGEQPLSVRNGYIQVQAVEKIINQRENIPSHAEAVTAPTAAAEPATVGAPLPAASAEAAVAKAPATSLFKSPWTLGLLGIMVTAAGAFILL